jgi:hypothetical protein
MYLYYQGRSIYRYDYNTRICWRDTRTSTRCDGLKNETRELIIIIKSSLERKFGRE